MNIRGNIVKYRYELYDIYLYSPVRHYDINIIELPSQSELSSVLF